MLIYEIPCFQGLDFLTKGIPCYSRISMPRTNPDMGDIHPPQLILTGICACAWKIIDLFTILFTFVNMPKDILEAFFEYIYGW